MLKTKALRPSWREKKRYIVYEVQGSTQPMNRLQEQLVQKLKDLLGVFLASQAGIMPVKYEGKRGILKVNHTAVDHIKACFVLITTLAKEQVTIQSINVSGVLKQAKTHLQIKE